MKTVCFSLHAAVAAAMFAAFTSCTGEMDSERQSVLSSETVSVTLSALGADFLETPMTKSNLTEGLYGVEIEDTKSHTIHACWLTEDLSSQSFKLVKGTTYGVLVVFVPGGKEVLESSNGVYGPPFMHENGPEYPSPVLGHDIYYGDEYNIKTSFNGRAQKKGHSSWLIQSNLLNDVDVYYGTASITPQEDLSLDVNLYRCMFGLHIDACNLKEGKVHIYARGFSNDSYADVRRNNGIIYTLTPEESSMDKALELIYMADPNTTEENLINSSSDTELSIDYEYPDGSIVTLFQGTYTFKRMYRYSFSFDLEDILETVTGGMSINISEEEWKDSTLDDALEDFKRQFYPRYY